MYKTTCRKKPNVGRLAAVLLAVLLCVSALLAGCAGDGGEVESNAGRSAGVENSSNTLDKNGTYDSKEDVKEYLIEYGELPNNYITKNEARDLGWDGGSVERYAKGKCIGGDRFGNYEGALPQNSDKDYYHECDIDTLGKKSRGAKRIIYAKDGAIYYTDDHYDTFTKLN